MTKDDGDGNNSRVPNKTDDQRMYESRYILYHSNVEDRKNHKKTNNGPLRNIMVFYNCC